jgi:hypothetical protein
VRFGARRLGLRAARRVYLDLDVAILPIVLFLVVMFLFLVVAMFLFFVFFAFFVLVFFSLVVLLLRND